ncbi:glycosyltransferase [Pyrobaculum calidifontis]|uniref:Glycosyl transferase, group 1 n=1 Tax=Pyrobaculum calidifontis (strain DSM 21063 / JCM 11548 / VA1) TaxID=410359 RepID=A3MTD9_PYRCJ|nr:glycosyltransferase [Pyrobaculum calidifontis]ABO07906.1 glycosyl transferase, group 1 [Pyrobaculum calidifontis JCM 11548]
MRVLAVVEDWPDRGGGLLATELWLKAACREVEVVVVGPRPFPPCPHLPHPLPHQRPKLWLTRPRVDLAKFDVLYIPRYAYHLIPAAKRLGLRAVVHMHGYPTYLSTGQPHDWRYETATVKRLYAAAAAKAVETLIDKWLRQADAVICVSRAHCARLEKYRVVYVPNPPPPVPQISAPRARRFVYPWGPRPFKGPHIARAVAKALGTELVETGELSRGEYYHVVATSKALLAPALWDEPYGYAVVEAMMLGTPPVAFARGAIPELVEGTEAEAYLAHNLAEFAKAAKKALEEPPPPKLAKEAREKFRTELDRFLKALMG